LGQAGTAWGAYGLLNDQGWTEVLPGEPSSIAAPIFTRPGRLVLTETQYQSRFYAPLWNLRPGYTFFIDPVGSKSWAAATGVLPQDFSGDSAEGILERPTLMPGGLSFLSFLPNLPSYLSSPTFLDDWANGQAFGSPSFTAGLHDSSMYDHISGGQLMMKPGDLLTGRVAYSTYISGFLDNPLSCN
jgi:hypothetical protein